MRPAASRLPAFNKTVRKIYAGFLGGLGAGLLLVSCSPESSTNPTSIEPSPLLYQVRSPDGEVEAWLFGTIHALPDGVDWRTAELEEVSAKADFLIAEIADLDNRAAIANTFTLLAKRAEAESILLRVPPEKRDDLRALVARSQFDHSDLSKVDTWAAALMLAQLVRGGKSENGVDRAMIEEFSDRPIREFEGVRKQLGIFDGLAEEDQRQLLVAVMGDIGRAEAQSGELREAWLAGDEAALITATERGMMDDPELRDALLVERNRDWTAQLLKMLPSDKEPMIAVGAGHLVGPDGLPAMLEAEGYTVSRIQ